MGTVVIDASLHHSMTIADAEERAVSLRAVAEWERQRGASSVPYSCGILFIPRSAHQAS